MHRFANNGDVVRQTPDQRVAVKMGRRLPISANLRFFGVGSLPRPVRRSQDATFALRATARPQYQGRAIAKRRRDEGGRGKDSARGFNPGKDPVQRTPSFRQSERASALSKPICRMCSRTCPKVCPTQSHYPNRSQCVGSVSRNNHRTSGAGPPCHWLHQPH